MCVNKKSRVVKTTSMYSVTTAVQIAFMSGREWWLYVQGSICGDLAADRRLYASKRVCAPIAWAALELKDEFAAQQMVTVKVQFRMKSRSGQVALALYIGTLQKYFSRNLKSWLAMCILICAFGWRLSHSIAACACFRYANQWLPADA